jgi:hypothetical protein
VLGGIELGLDAADHAVRDLVLHGEHVVEIPVVALGPEVIGRLGLHELTGDANTVAGLSHAALEHVANAHLTSDLTDVHAATLVGEARVARDDEQPAEARQTGNDVLGDPVREMSLLGIAAHVDERQHRDGGLAGKGERLLSRGRDRGGRGRCSQPVHAHGTGDVLELALAEIVEGQVETIAHLVVHGTRDEHAAGIGQRLQPRRDVDAVTVDPGLVVDDVAQVDTDAKEHPAVLGDVLVPRRHDPLDVDRALRRPDDAGKLGEDAVPRRIDDAAAVLSHEGQDGGLMCLEVANSGGLVLAHQSAVPGDIGGENGRQPPSHRGGLLHRPRHAQADDSCICASTARPSRP